MLEVPGHYNFKARHSPNGHAKLLCNVHAEKGILIATDITEGSTRKKKNLGHVKIKSNAHGARNLYSGRVATITMC